MRLLTQNGELRPDGIWNWTIPAHLVTLTDGTRFNACPHAGVCARMCYAKQGTYKFSNVLSKHVSNLELTLYDPEGFRNQMVAEIGRKRKINALRIHDAGDFYSEDYLLNWCEIANQVPDLLFYAYTKEVSMVKRNLDKIPKNLVIIFSMGGTEDHLVDKENDRHADVFSTVEDLEAAGYFNQEENDLWAATAPSNKIGIVQNNIPQFKKRLDGGTFSGKQLSVTNSGVSDE